MAEKDHSSMVDLPEGGTPEGISITLNYAGTSHMRVFPLDATITDLSEVIEAELSIPASNQKFLVPKMPLLKPPFKDPAMSLVELQGKQVKLMGSTAQDVDSLTEASKAASARQAALAHQRRHQPRMFKQVRFAEESQYTFMAIRPLPNLSHPERSQKFLERLKADPGIVAAMRKHKFMVGLLTEMDPLSYTESNHEGTTRVLGLNRNKGEVIELRLRTDAYDGYRDYKTIRNTLCHELAHNVHGPHDRQFWDLCHQIEKEVAKADWRSGGRSVGEGEFYEPSEEVAYDHGGWYGGEFVLGGGGSASSTAADPNTLSRREVIARAAEQRRNARRNNEESKGGPSQRPGDKPE